VGSAVAASSHSSASRTASVIAEACWAEGNPLVDNFCIAICLAKS
jgi:hypothetical protein